MALGHPPGVAAGGTLPYAVWNMVVARGYPFLTFNEVQIEVKAGWNMVSVPAGLSGGSSTVAEVFGNEIVAIYLWNPVESYAVPTVLEPDPGLLGRGHGGQDHHATRVDSRLSAARYSKLPIPARTST